MSAPHEILFVLPSLGGGGAEKVFVDILQRLDRKRFSSTLALVDRSGVYLNAVPGDVPVHALSEGRHRIPAMTLRLARLCRRLRPDAIVSALWYADMIHLLANVGPHRACSVVSVHAHPAAMYEEGYGRIKLEIMRRLYRRAAESWCVSGPVATSFSETFRVDDVRVQRNPIDARTLARLASEPGESPRRATHRIVAVGRLHPHKGIDVLLDAMPMLLELADVELIIAGEGDERGNLEKQVRDLGVAHAVTFRGYLKNPYPLMVSADLLVAPSRTEAAALVLVEAQALGVPFVATDAPGGSAEIAEGGASGRLVPVGEPRALAVSIAELLGDVSARTQLANAGRRAAESYHSDRVVAEIERRLELLIRSWRKSRRWL